MKNYKISMIKKLTLVLVMLIGISSSFPGPNSNVTVHFTGMTPHLNQNLYLRVVDKGTMKETGRTMQQITAADFDIVLDAVTAGRSYFIDFFADLNMNGIYDAPPADHAWRLELNDAAGNDELNFAHNTNFTDIKWPYVLTVNFTGMTPHIGQLLELRVEDNAAGKEVDRIKVSSIPAADFNVQIVGLKLNTEYKVEFYADLNGNGLYDTPPTDHAWEMNFTNNTGDYSLDFSHNINFTDINWKYLLTVNLNSMTPHLGQLFELRVVRQDNQEEIGRVSLPAVLVPDFTIYVPEFELNHGYNIDFYADFNGNGIYDAPPADHAWRLTFNSASGDFVQDFTHNTNFTDIQWPNPTAVDEIKVTGLQNYELLANYPNPFNPSTTISYQLPQSGFVSLKVFDALGKEVAVLANERRNSGYHSVEFNAKDLSSGLYFYQLKVNNFISTKKMLLIK